MLINVASNGNFNVVQQLVENGANVNLRDNSGATAASIAYDKGELDIYNYLKEHGAVDFELKAVAAPAPSSTTNVYVQPPAQSAPPPAQSAAPAYSLRINSIWGVYSSTGFVTINGSSILFTGPDNKTSTGTCSISGSTLSVSYTMGPLAGNRFTYTIESKDRFSNRGETYHR
jgi:hypothetical protein